MLPIEYYMIEFKDARTIYHLDEPNVPFIKSRQTQH